MPRIELITSLVLAVSFITKISLSLHLLSDESKALASHTTPHADTNLLSALIGFFIMFAVYSYFIFFRSFSKSALSYKLTSLWLGLTSIVFVSLGIMLSVQTKSDYHDYKTTKDKAQHILNIILTLVSGLFLAGVVYKRLRV